MTKSGTGTTPAKGTVTISGNADRSTTAYPCGNNSCPTQVYDYGQVELLINNSASVYVTYGSGSSSSSLASQMAAAINSTTSLPVTATSSGSVVTVTSKEDDTGANSYTLTGISFSQDGQYFSGTSFPESTSSMTGGTGSAIVPFLAYSLDGEGRPSGVTDMTNPMVQTNLVSAISYSPWSTPTSITYGSGDSDAFTLDSNTGRIKSYSNKVIGSSPFTSTGTLTWNPIGSLGKFVWVDGNDATKDQTCNYTSDALNRLAMANCGAIWSQTFTYDPFGNINKQANGGNTYNATYSPTTNQVKAGVTATYDANGNQQMSQTFSTLSWDAMHNAVSAGSTAMTYDALGRLVEFGGNHQVVYGPAGEKLAVYSDTNNSSTASVALPGGGEALYISGVLTAYRRKDWLGSSRLATTPSSTVYSKTAYAPFGESYNTAGTSDLNFTGQTQDSVGGVYDFPARKYDPIAGRWTKPDPGGWGVADPSNPQSLNRYAYVLNMPLRAVDRNGLISCFYGGQGDTPQNDDDASDYSETDSGLECTSSGGQIINYNDGISVNANAPTSCQDASCNGQQAQTVCLAENCGQFTLVGPAPSDVAKRLACAAKYGQADSIGAAFGGGKLYTLSFLSSQRSGSSSCERFH